MSYIHQQQRCRMSRKRGFCDLVEGGAHGGLSPSHGPSISEARQIDQVERGRRSACHPVHVCQPCLAGRRACPRYTLPKQRIDQARFADIRTSYERHFRQAVVRKVGRASGARDEFSGDFQLKGLDGLEGPDSQDGCWLINLPTHPAYPAPPAHQCVMVSSVMALSTGSA